MTTTEILLSHNINFVNIESGLDLTPTKFFMGGGEMENFFLFFKSTEDIETEVIPVIDHYLAGNLFPIDNDLTVGGGDYVEVTLSGVKFINRDTLVEEQSVPLDHFREIALAWANFNRNDNVV